MQTVRHFWPELNDWIEAIEDPRFLPFVVYAKRFLVWWGLGLFLFKLGSRRQLDYELDARDTHVLDNLNRLAGTRQTTRPVHNTLRYFVGRIGAPPLARLRAQMVRRLVRMKVFQEARLQRHYRILLDGTGFLVFRARHCEYCLEQRCHDTTLYLHQVLEAKLLGPHGVVASLATEFIDNRDLADTPADASAERRKQDCELKAAARLLPRLRRDFPQLDICVCGDSIYGCGTGLALARAARAAYVFTLKAGRLPSLWADFQHVLPLCPENQVTLLLPGAVRQEYRWVGDLAYRDSQGRDWTVTAVQCREQTAQGTTTYAWLTDLAVTRKTVVGVATHGGRARWCIENEGFNTQKNTDLNLEHAYSRRCWEAFYYLLQIAHLILQLLEKGSLLRQLADQTGKTVAQLFGSLKNIARRLLESVRRLRWPDEAYDAARARRRQIRLDSS